MHLPVFPSTTGGAVATCSPCPAHALSWGRTACNPDICLGKMRSSCVQQLPCPLQALSCLNVARRLLLFASVWVASAMPAVPKGQPVVTCIPV